MSLVVVVFFVCGLFCFLFVHFEFLFCIFTDTVCSGLVVVSAAPAGKSLLSVPGFLSVIVVLCLNINRR